MDPEIKRKWVEALRSGEYVQGQAKLKRDGMHCCLGVLCEVANPPGWDSTLGCIREKGVMLGQEEDDFWTLPPATAALLRVNDDQQQKLMDMNDHAGATFEQIADFIEKNL